MKNYTANSTFSCPEFEELLKDKSNKVCFDCGEAPASWASVNNGIYLCMNCAGVHRSFGVTLSYIRSITIDTWNETQINFMKAGGNKRLDELLTLFEIPKSTPAEVIYSSKLLEYHRNQLKSDVNNGKQLIPPKLEEALLPCNSSASINQNKNFNSVSSTSIDLDPSSNTSSEKKNGFFSSVGFMFNSALEKSKTVASNVKEKVKDMELTNKIYTSGSYTIEKLKETGNIVKDKGTKTVEVLKDTSSKVVAKGMEVGATVKEKGTELAQSETVQNLKNKVGSGVNYFYGRLFGKKSENNSNEYDNYNTEPTKIIKNDDLDNIYIDNEFTSPDIKK